VPGTQLYLYEEKNIGRLEEASDMSCTNDSAHKSKCCPFSQAPSVTYTHLQILLWTPVFHCFSASKCSRTDRVEELGRGGGGKKEKEPKIFI